ncbi:Fanconi anemia group A protein-like [Xenia sp. Carnegie-2017]|uniref:Fanconi anemia group A protein-like n=1 Tax=Xenia sp. Carnegie-2017 TaxID=2897299 RepID=UPI001F03BD9E|nr:Fanconi anemia group A protein-like [Xenia sp. Carnegie-2017]
MVILLRRQLSQEGHISLPYSSWFEQTFVRKGPSFLEMNTKKSIHFIFKSLTELVPHDQPEFLKIHVTKSAQISSKFRENIDDYISLAKTRLRELNIPMEENTGLFSQCSTTNEEMKVMEQAMEDVERCLAIYDESGKIPITVMEASIFRKPYFIGRFLPSLLTPRKPTNDVRSRFIDDLNRAGKIPAPMFKSYERKCENWEDYAKDVELLDNVQKLSKFLTKLPNILIAMLNTSEINQVDLKSWLSGLSRKLKAFFGHQEFTNIGTVDVTVVTSKMEKEHFEVSHAVMNVFCRACAAVQSSRSENEDQSIKYKFDWVLKFLSIILTFPSLVQCLFVHLWSSICVESHLLSAEHTHGLAILVCHLSTIKTPCKIHFQGNFKLDVAPEPTIHQTLVDLIYAELSVKSKTLLQFYLRFSFQYLQYALVLFEDVTTDTGKLLPENHRTFGCAYVPLGMCKKMDYLFNKLKFRTGECEENDLLKSDEAKLFEVLMKTIKDKGFLNQSYTMKQWLIWELQITEDTLHDNERLQYYYWIIYEKFIVALGDENTYMVYRKIAQEIILSLFQCWTSSDSANDERTNRSLPTEKHLLKILQDILNISGSSHTQSNVAETQSWFLVFMETIFDEIETDDESSKELSLRSKVMAFVRISTQLPPSLLLSSFEIGSENPLQRETILSLSQFLNKYLKPFLFDRRSSLRFYSVYLKSMCFPFKVNAMRSR